MPLDVQGTSRDTEAMNRRDLLVSGAAVGVGLLAHRADAQPKPAPKPTPKPEPKPDARTALLAALSHCLTKAQACQAHCDSQLATGNKEFARCAAAVAETLAIGWATQTLVGRKSARAKKLVEVCAASCKECSAACLEHKEHWVHGMHLECKECMESCDACIKACSAFLAA